MIAFPEELIVPFWSSDMYCLSSNALAGLGPTNIISRILSINALAGFGPDIVWTTRLSRLQGT